MANPKKQFMRLLTVATVLVGVPLGASAQEGEAAATTPESPWAKLCNADPATGKELCLTIQEIRADTGQFIASATIRTIAGEEKKSLITAVPPGMLLQPGLRVQVDDQPPTDVKYGICFPNACYAEIEVNDDFVGKLKAGGRLTITTLNQQAKPVNFPMTLAGFTKAYDGQGLDQAAQQARESELADALARRAENARQKLIEQQQKETGGD